MCHLGKHNRKQLHQSNCLPLTPVEFTNPASKPVPHVTATRSDEDTKTADQCMSDALKCKDENMCKWLNDFRYEGTSICSDGSRSSDF